MFYVILQYWNNGSLTIAHGRSSFHCLACVLACHMYTNTDKFKQSSHNVILLHYPSSSPPNTSPSLHSLHSLLLHYMHTPAVTSPWIMQVIQCRLDHQKCTHAHEHAALDMHVLYIIINLSSFSLFNPFFTPTSV